MFKILLGLLIIVSPYSYSQELNRDNLLDALKPTLDKLNKQFNTSVGILLADEDDTYGSWADYKNNAARMNGEGCGYRLKSCQVVLAHEFVHLVFHPPKDYIEGDYYGDIIYPEEKDKDKVGLVGILVHTNTDVLAVKVLLASGVSLTEQDIKTAYLDLHKFNSVVSKSKGEEEYVGRAIMISLENAVRAFREGLESNHNYIKLGIITNFSALKKSFIDYPGVLEPFYLATPFGEDSIYFTREHSEVEREKFIPELKKLKEKWYKES